MDILQEQIDKVENLVKERQNELDKIENECMYYGCPVKYLSRNVLLDMIRYSSKQLLSEQNSHKAILNMLHTHSNMRYYK